MCTDSDSDEDVVDLEPLSFSRKLTSATCHSVADESRIPKSSRLNALFSLSTQVSHLRTSSYALFDLFGNCFLQLQTKISDGPVKKKQGSMEVGTFR